ncbi:MAG: nicotinamide mononucleotide transporter [Clostridiales bacterium]|nr:nicotinamide mononucleotide transporter [Clostridiales bacterium]
MNFFNLSSTFLTIWGYELSFLEFLATIFGILNVYLLAKIKVSNYFWGILNVILSFFIFFQIQMYSDMFLQVYYLAMNIYGWWMWLHPKNNSQSNDAKLKVSKNSLSYNLIAALLTVIGFVFLGFFLKNIHVLLPTLFIEPSRSPFIDSFITVLSIVAMFFMAKKKIEHWYLWFIADFTSVVFCYMQNIKFLALEYFIFLFFAFLGYMEWRKELLSET